MELSPIAKHVITLPEKRKNQIRRSVSYQRWRRLAEFLQRQPSIGDVLSYIDGMLNTKYAHRSTRAAISAAESRYLLVQDIGDDKWLVLKGGNYDREKTD